MIKAQYKKYKAPVELAGLPVFVIAENLNEAKTLWALKLVSVGTVVNNSKQLDLSEVEFSEAAKTH